MNNNRGLLIVISVLLLGIFVVLAAGPGRERPEGISGSIGEVVEEIGDEIDDNTDAR